jgi:acyl dehydratase
MQVKHDQTYIYADGSGDHNPIHVDPAFAKQVGLPGIILQGLCTAAFCFKAIQDNTCGKDPARVQSLQVRFARPVLPLDTVTTRAWIEDKMSGTTALGFDAVNQKGDVVIRNGLASVLTA